MESLDFCHDLLDKMKSQNIQYYLITFRPDNEGSGQIDEFNSIDLMYADAFLETLSDTLGSLDEAYCDFTDKIIKEMEKDQKKQKKTAKLKKIVEKVEDKSEPIDPCI